MVLAQLSGKYWFMIYDRVPFSFKVFMFCVCVCMITITQELAFLFSKRYACWENVNPFNSRDISKKNFSQIDIVVLSFHLFEFMWKYDEEKSHQEIFGVSLSFYFLRPPSVTFHSRNYCRTHIYSQAHTKIYRSLYSVDCMKHDPIW